MPRLANNITPTKRLRIELIQDDNLLLSYKVTQTEMSRTNYLEASSEDLLDTLLTYAADDDRVEFELPENLENISIRLVLIDERETMSTQSMESFWKEFTMEKALNELHAAIYDHLEELRDKYPALNNEDQFSKLIKQFKEQL